MNPILSTAGLEFRPGTADLQPFRLRSSEENVNILLVDDQPESLLALEAMLQGLHQNLVLARSGREALKHLLTKEFAVILLDVYMPDMDGFETAALIREREGLRDTPIIFLTAAHRGGDQVFQGYAAGAVDYMVKPIVPEILRSKVSVFVELARKRNELIRQGRLLRESEASFRMIVEHVPAVTYTALLNDEFPFLYVSPQIEKLLGYSSSEWQKNPSLRFKQLFPEDRDAVLRELNRCRAAGDVFVLEYRMLARNGHTVWFHDRALVASSDPRQPSVLRGVMMDITDRKNLEAQLYHAQKLESIGQLAAGVAHEINNPVAFVKSNLHTLTSYVDRLKEILIQYEALTDAVSNRDRTRTWEVLSRLDQLREKEDLSYVLKDLDPLLADSLDGARRIQEIVQSLKNFARSDEGEVKDIHVNDLIEATLKVVWSELKHKCRVNKKLGELPPIRGYPTQINQLLMNLIVNAAQAIPKKGEVTIETEATDAEVIIRITDTGEGIPPENLSKLFTPFFTTKPAGTGLGLGLSIAYSIAQNHGGTIEAASDVGKGTTFTVRLPFDRTPKTVEKK